MKAVLGNLAARRGTLELIGVGVAILTWVVSARYLQDFSFRDADGRRYAALLLSCMPALFVYCVGRLVLPALTTGLLVAIGIFSLTSANRVKLAMTNEPLTWSDVSSTANASIIGHYINTQQVVILIVTLVVLVLSFKLDPIRRRSCAAYALTLGCCLLLAPVALYPYAEVAGDEFAESMNSTMNRYGISYMPWNWARSVRRNGLAYHLVHTSRRTFPQLPTEAERIKFAALQTQAKPDAGRPKNVILVLCESCWHDENHFDSEFEPLRQLGFQSFRGVSPVYGGATVNASFEILTGLPVGAPLTGIIYQEYAADLSDAIWAYPQVLRRDGYSAVTVHNHYRTFFKRDVVNPKLGFDRFVGLEDIGYDGPIWADDRVLFDAASLELNEPSERKFMYLVTVRTHGGYEPRGDSGEGDYAERLGATVAQTAKFVQAALAKEPDSLVVVFGDHKPALTKYFYEQGLFSREEFSVVGQKSEDFRFAPGFSRRKRGDVPIFVYHPNADRLARFVRQAHGSPFYCLGQLLDREFTQARLPVFEYASRERLCADFDRVNSDDGPPNYPEWLYSLSLFGDGERY